MTTEDKAIAERIAQHVQKQCDGGDVGFCCDCHTMIVPYIAGAIAAERLKCQMERREDLK